MNDPQVATSAIYEAFSELLDTAMAKREVVAKEVEWLKRNDDKEKAKAASRNLVYLDATIDQLVSWMS